MREKDFENQVKAYLKKHGAWILKTWSNGVQREGVPDILACVDGYFVGIEVKAEKGTPSDLQLWNIRNIRKAGGIAFVLYPDQYDDFVYVIEHRATAEQERFDKRLTEEQRRILYGTAGQ